MRVFASSDHHFYHRNIIKYANRPFDINDPNCVIDNAKLMIQRHNEVVTDDDIVLMVGDLSASLRNRQEHFMSLLKLLKGKKILFRGNHDHMPNEFYKAAGFTHVFDSLKVGKYFICHYPCYESVYNKEPEREMVKIRNNFSDIEVIIPGHIHNKDPDTFEPDGFKRMNVSVDFAPNKYYPQELTDPVIIDFFENL